MRHRLTAALRVRASQGIEAVAALPRALSLWSDARPGGAPRLHYGHARLPASSEVAHGGLVKAQLLQAEFPASRSANILYLVSSSLPSGAPILARFARWAGARLVWNQDGVAYPAWHGPGWQATNALLGGLLRHADHVFYQSDFCRMASERFLGVPAARAEVLYNAVDTHMFRPAEAPLPERPLVLLLAGNQDQRYRVRAALETLRLVRERGLEARLVVTGRLGWDEPGPAQAWLERTITELGLDGAVERVGPYSRTEAPVLFRRAHVMLHTKYNDPCPGVVLEALATGLPVVYSGSGGVPELVGEHAGKAVPAALSWDEEQPPDPNALADAVAAVAAERAALSAAARRRAVERFDVRPWLERHRQVFLEMVASA